MRLKKFSKIACKAQKRYDLVGTQPVNDEQLPADLLAFAPKSEWHTLPAMSESAVLLFLAGA